MAKKQQHDQGDGLYKPRDAKTWWYDLARELAGEHWLQDVAEQAYREGLTPRGAADRMKAK